jgi:hypothetical protein
MKKKNNPFSHLLKDENTTKALAYGLMILSVFGMSIEAFRSAQK